MHISELDFAYSVEGLDRFRVNAYLSRGTIGLAFRLVQTEVPGIRDLGLPEVCETLSLKPRGLVLVTGPTGSGKSTTLAAAHYRCLSSPPATADQNATLHCSRRSSLPDFTN
ncbi:MAG: ATPase, T2SS/T4P/T4SS family [Dehalococcoidia bacterium]